MNRRTFVRDASLAVAGLGLAGTWAGPAFGGTEVPPSAGLTPIRLGVLGAGERGLAVAAAMTSARPDVSVTGVCDIRDERVAQARRAHGPLSRYPSYLELLEAADVDAVVVATPAYLYAEHVSAALLSGRDVYTVAAGTTSAHERRQVRDALRSSNRRLHIVSSTRL